jgi:hypothetical protein
VAFSVYPLWLLRANAIFSPVDTRGEGKMKDKAIYKKGYMDAYNGLVADKTDHIDYNNGYRDGCADRWYVREIENNPNNTQNSGD